LHAPQPLIFKKTLKPHILGFISVIYKVIDVDTTKKLVTSAGVRELEPPPQYKCEAPINVGYS